VITRVRLPRDTHTKTRAVAPEPPWPKAPTQHRYDAEGQLTNGSCMDYCMPRAADLPNLKVGNHVADCVPPRSALGATAPRPMPCC
jgi:hypothetical protein